MPSEERLKDDLAFMTEAARQMVAAIQDWIASGKPNLFRIEACQAKLREAIARVEAP